MPSEFRGERTESSALSADCPIGQFEPGGVTDLPARSWTGDDDGERVVHDFRRLVRRRLGEIGVAVSTCGCGRRDEIVGGLLHSAAPVVCCQAGRATDQAIGTRVCRLARRPGFLRDIERAMASEEETVAKRRMAMAARQAVGV